MPWRTALFFQAALGNHGLGEESTWENSSYDGSHVYRYKRQYQTLDPDSVPDDLENAVEPVGYTIENNGYTLTIDSMIADENDCGIVQFTLKNPKGVKYKRDGNETHALILEEDDSEGIKQIDISLETADDLVFDTRCFYNSKTSTNTEVHGTLYFTPIGHFAPTGSETAPRVAGGLKWSLGSDPDIGVAETEVFVPSKLAGTRQFSDGNEATASLSPFSIVYRANNKQRRGTDDQLYPAEFVTHTLALHKADGADYIVEQDNAEDAEPSIVNSYVSALMPDGYVAQIFTQLVDTGSVDSITMTGSQDGEDLSLELTPTE